MKVYHFRVRVLLMDGTVRRFKSYDNDEKRIIENVGQLFHGQIAQMVVVRSSEEAPTAA